MMRDALYEEVESKGDTQIYEQYQEDPVGFGTNVLKETFTEDVSNVMISVRDNPVTIARSANATGKTHGAARVCIWFYKCFPGSQVYTAAAPPEDNLRRLLWGEIGSIVEKYPGLFADDDFNLNSMRIARSTISFVVGVSIPQSGTPKQREAKFSGKHAPYLLFVLDEGDAIPPEIYSGIESCMSGGHARLLIMYNPRNQFGHTYQMETEHRANVVQLTAFRHPNVTSGKDKIPGAVTRDKTVGRINAWTRPLHKGEHPDKSCFEVPDFLVRATAPRDDGGFWPPLPQGWRKVVDPSFSYMVLGEYPSASENKLINSNWIEDAQRRWQEHVARFGFMPVNMITPVLGGDIADLGGDLNVVTIRYEDFIAPQLMWSGVEPATTAEEIERIYKYHRATAVYVDANGVGAGVPGILRRLKCKAYRIMTSAKATEDCPEGQFGRVRDQAYWRLREWLRTNPRSMIPNDEKLAEELNALHYYRDDYGRIKVTAKEKLKDIILRSPDRSDSIMLTFCPVPDTSDGPTVVTRYR